MFSEVLALGLGLSTVMAADVDSAPGSSSAMPSTAELHYLEKQLRDRSTARYSLDGIRYEVHAPSVAQEGIAFQSSTTGTQGPIPWSQIDTVWVHENRVTTFALFGTVLGGVIGASLGNSEDAGEYAGLTKMSATVTGIVVGAGVGIAIGRAIRTWRRVYPVEPAKLSRGWSLF